MQLKPAVYSNVYMNRPSQVITRVLNNRAHVISVSYVQGLEKNNNTCLVNTLFSCFIKTSMWFILYRDMD